METSIQIHSCPPECAVSLVNDDEYFGVLTIKLGKTDRVQNTTFLLFTVDRTGSMNEGDKMKYIKDTFKNMIKYIATQNADIYIQVNVFNIEVDVCIDAVKVSFDNMEELIQKIDAIEADGSTAIDAALESAKTTMSRYIEENPNHLVHHILMTDGEATFGEKNNGKLAAMVSGAYPNTFIGFGYKHNSTLLRKMSETDRASYDFVDNVEHTGLVYGDILHSLMYPALFDVTIRAKNGSLYNWKTNSWVQEITEYLLVSETEKNYHVKCSERDEVEIEVFGKYNANDASILIDTVKNIPALINGETGELMHHTYDLSKYVFRQAVLDKLFTAKSNDRIDTHDKCKKDMTDLFSKLRTYMKESDNEDDAMLKQLCDDLSIAYKTLGTEQGQVLSCARQTSQGRQQSRNVSTPTQHIQSRSVFAPPIYRQNANPFYRVNAGTGITPLFNFPDMDDDFNTQSDETEIETYVPSENPISCYATTKATDTMRHMTQS
jgi:hypothetical protein